MLTTLNFFYHFQLIPFQKIFYSCKILYPTFLHGWPQTFYLSTLLKLNFFSLDRQKISKIHNIFTLQFLQIQQYNLFLLLEILVLSLILIFLFLIIHISYISKSCFSHICDLRRNTLDHKTACTIATSLIHSKLDYCNSLYLNISNQQLNRLQLFSTLLLVLSQKLQNSITIITPISNHFTGSKLRNAYNTKFFH